MLPMFLGRTSHAASGWIRGGRTLCGFARWVGVLLRLYLAAAISGCATAPPPTAESVREMETRTLEAGFFTTIRAITNVLQDTGYTIDAAEAETGIVSATKETTREIAEISEEDEDGEEEDEGVPVWAQVLIIATIVPIVIWLIAQSDDDDDDEDVSVASATVSTATSATAYRYRLMFNIEPYGPGRTRVRLSARGSEISGGSIEKAGPIHDPEFFARFFDAIQVAIPPMPPEDAEEGDIPGDDD